MHGQGQFENAARTIDGCDWLERSRYWSEQFGQLSNKRKVRERSPNALILCGHGISLRVENGTLSVRDGLTHHPQVRREYRYFRGDLDRPARIIVLDGSGHLTFDVIDWLAEQETPLIRVSWQGEATTVVGGVGYAADRPKVEWQRAVRADAHKRVEFSAALIAHKIGNSIVTLGQAIPPSPARDRAVTIAEKAIERISTNPPTSISELHGIEGPAAASYFEAWQGIPLRWRMPGRTSIPGAWRSLGPRASMREGKKSKNRNATHPVNAMLNYGYALAVAVEKIRALADGYDPSIGIMHQNTEAPAYALDLVEPVRPLVDRAVLNFALDQELHPADFIIRGDGACRLNPQLARSLVEMVATTA